MRKTLLILLAGHVVGLQNADSGRGSCTGASRGRAEAGAPSRWDDCRAEAACCGDGPQGIHCVSRRAWSALIWMSGWTWTCCRNALTRRDPKGTGGPVPARRGPIGHLLSELCQVHRLWWCHKRKGLPLRVHLIDSPRGHWRQFMVLHAGRAPAERVDRARAGES